MSEGWQSLLLEDLEVSAPGVKVLRLCLNRHLPETSRVRPHRHSYSQILLYLGGSGWQDVEGERLPVTTGRLIGIPPETSHAFRKERSRSPLCLVVDLEPREDHLVPIGSTLLGAESLSVVRRSLHWLARKGGGKSAATGRVREWGEILQITGILLDSLLVPEPGQERLPVSQSGSTVLTRVRNALPKIASELWSGENVSRQLGEKLDRLNRRLKAESGLTLGQVIAHHRLLTAQKALLVTEGEIQEVAAAVGILDRNYFARWFRRQTGLSPSEWRRRHR